MANKPIAQIENSRKGSWPRTGAYVPCDCCGATTWRKLSQLVKGTKSGKWFCSRRCQNAESRKVTLTCATCGTRYERFVSQGVRGTRTFCSRRCMGDHGLSSVKCFWPECTNTLPCRVIRGGSRAGNDTFKTKLVKRGNYTRFILCDGHRALAKKHLGRDARLSCGRNKLLTDPDAEFGGRAINSEFLRLVVFDRAGHRCESCRRPLKFSSPENSWHTDHKTPVFKGGKTALSNLQILCITCHDIKSAPEKAEASKTRHTRTKLGRWLTHFEKDEIIARLRARLRELGAPDD